MDTSWINEFIELASSKGFNKAAKKLYVSQSSLSAHISHLEEYLGAKLVNRDSEKFELTRAGRVFLGYAKSINSLLEEAQTKVQEAEHNLSSVKVPSNLFPSTVVRALNAQFDVVFEFIDLDLDETHYESLLNGTIDIGFDLQGSHEQSAERLREEERIGWCALPSYLAGIACSKESSLASLTNLTRNDLRGASFLIGSAAWDDVEKRQIFEALGEDLDFNFVLQFVKNETELGHADLGEVLAFCGIDSLRKRYFDRDDIVIFDKLDGEPISYSSGGFIYRKDESGLIEQIATVAASLFATR